MSLFFLVGMPCAGKTYWGKAWAAACNLPFTDLDAYIENINGLRIPEIFATEGETAFREKERDCLQALIKQAGNGIIACGGGTPAYYNNLQQMKGAGCVIYLQAGIATLVSRLGSSSDRPLLQGGGDIHQKMTAILKERKPFYEQAHVIVDAENVSVLTFEKIIEECTNRQS